MRYWFGYWSRIWHTVLTEAQRRAWIAAAASVETRPRCGQSGKRTGQAHFVGFNSTRSCVGAAPCWDPPAPVVFGPIPIGELTITHGADGVRLLVRVTGPLTEDLMVFGQAPCSAGRMKRRNVAYLGLLPAPQDGQSDITAQYLAKYGEPKAGEKVFLVLRPQKDGWKGLDHDTNAVVPENTGDAQARTTVATPLPVAMHKGCPRDAEGTLPPPIPCLDASGTVEMPGRQAAESASGGSASAGGGADGPG